MKWSEVIFVFLLLSSVAQGQSLPDSEDVPIKRKQLRIAAVSAGAVYTAGLAGLNHLWYRHADQQPFRFFDDNAEWKQVDKLGHFYASFHLSQGFARGLRHYNVPARKSDLTGALLGFAVLLPIEVFDGFSAAYGASVGDILADAGGAAFYLAQTRLWNEVRIHPKFSFRYSSYAGLRPELLGEGLERIIKDYNGQTYWLSFDMDKFARFPRWLNLAVGYGADGMIYARDEQHRPNGFAPPQRQLFLGVDFDVTAVNTRSRTVKTLLFFVNMIRIPAPALEFRDGRFRAHAFYF